MKKLFDLLYYGGLSQKHQERIYQEIDAANRKSVISYTSISLAAFIVMTLYAALGDNAVSDNVMSYVLGSLIMAVMLALNLTLAKTYGKVSRVTGYLFVITLLGIGIFLAINAKEDVTASYMVFLFVAPLLFILRPLFVIGIILCSDLAYVYIMYHIETVDMFQKNIVNAVIYGLLSVFVSTTMIRMRVQKIETDYVNQILMETDQLTGMLNRRSFEQHIALLEERGSVADVKFCAFDVNGLKQVNDTIGHHAGDELLRGAAACLENVFAKYGYCYRTGGDEFIAIIQNSSPTGEELIHMLNKQTVCFKGTYVPALSISAGIVTGTAEDTVAQLMRKADAKMYESKAEYYKVKGIDRRKRGQE